MVTGAVPPAFIDLDGSFNPDGGVTHVDTDGATDSTRWRPGGGPENLEAVAIKIFTSRDCDAAGAASDVSAVQILRE